MFGFTCRSWPRAAFNACAALVTAMSLCACSPDHSQTASLQTAAPAQSLASSSAAAAVDTPVSAIAQVSTSVALTPNFDPSIHDYVIQCSANPQVGLTVWLNGQNFVQFFGPDGAQTAPGYPVGQLQQAVTLLPNQGFRFQVGTVEPYSVRCLPADFPPLTVSVTGTREAEWYVFAPTVLSSSHYVIITDANGTPVWWFKDLSGSAIDANVLGPDEIIWSTQVASGSSTALNPSGRFVFRDFSGRILNVAMGNLDFHDLQPTAAGTYLAIRNVTRVCPPDCADMSPWGGSAQTAAIDAEILEIDANSNVLWTWRTRDHIALAETGLAGWFPGVLTDIIHMNSLQPDGTDGVIFSARHLNGVYHITKSTGAIDWKIGGVTTPQSLVVLNDTRPTAMGPDGQHLSGQHDARLWPDGTVSVHDNGTIAHRPPFVVRYQIDPGARTATVVEEFDDSRYPASPFIGSARRLPFGHWLVQWGGADYLTEFDSSANPVLTVNFNLGTAASYRATPVLPGVVAAETLRNGMDAMTRN